MRDANIEFGGDRVCDADLVLVALMPDDDVDDLLITDERETIGDVVAAIDFEEFVDAELVDDIVNDTLEDFD